jgi:uncharacterized protein (TIGR02996 family)
VFEDGKSSKFWNITLQGVSSRIRFGKVGTTGQMRLKTFPDEAQARQDFDKVVAQKLGEGYRETTSGPASAAPAAPTTSLREAMEAAIVANPSDRAARSAYADLLSEQSDARVAERGEFIAVQLALADNSRSIAERRALRAREQELLAAHQKTWLGGLGTFLLKSSGSPPCTFSFAGDWLDGLRIPHLTVPLASAVAAAPEVRLLRSLLIDDSEYEPDEVTDDMSEEEAAELCMVRLGESPHLGNVNVLRVGEPVEEDFEESLCIHSHGGGYLHLVRRLPKLEELYLLFRAEGTLPELLALPTLTRLRILQLYHQHSYHLDMLAANPAFANLTTLLCHPAAYGGRATCVQQADLEALCRSPHLPKLTHLRLRLTELGDDGCREIVTSGILKRLKILDLKLGSITDAGAQILADCPDLKHLDLLDLRYNALTAEGIATLEKTGVRVRMEDQHGPRDYEWYDIGDIE